MALPFDSGDVGNTRYHLGHMVIRINEAASNPSTDVVHLDAEVLIFEAMASNVTDDDDFFRKEWVQMREKFPENEETGIDEARDLARCAAQFRAIYRSLCRKGIFTKAQTNSTPYVPGKGAKSLQVNP